MAMRRAVVPFIIAINIVEAWQECCSASDFCCTRPKGSDNGVFHKPKTVDMFASCYIQGDGITSRDCPAGWTFDGNQCSFVPSSWERQENEELARFSTVKSCAASYSCPSAENVCEPNSKRWFTPDDKLYFTRDSY